MRACNGDPARDEDLAKAIAGIARELDERGLQTVHFAEYLGVLGGEALGVTRRERDGAASSSARRRTNGDTKVQGSVGGLWVKDGHKVLRSSHHPEDWMLASPAWSDFDEAASVLRGEGRLLAADWS
jgi:hypothetical protein